MKSWRTFILSVVAERSASILRRRRIVDAQGRKTRETWIVAPYAAMIHDFAVTENYVIFPLMPLTVDAERLRQGAKHFQWQPGLDQLFGVLRRDGDGRDVRWFTAPNGFQGHTCWFPRRTEPAQFRAETNNMSQIEDLRDADLPVDRIGYCRTRALGNVLLAR